jgi:hypothetical protein
MAITNKILSFAKKLFKTSVAFTAGSVLSAILVCSQLPAPGLNSTWEFSEFFFVVLFCLIGPILFPWALNPHPLNLLQIVIGLVSMIIFILTYRTWFIKDRGAAWLVASAAVWSVIGGYSALLIISGSI